MTSSCGGAGYSRDSLVCKERSEVFKVPIWHLKLERFKRQDQAVKRNIKRFPSDLMFELTKEEFQNLRSQFVISSWGGTRYAPMALFPHSPFRNPYSP